MSYIENYADFMFICFDGEVPVHRIILHKIPFIRERFKHDSECISLTVPFHKEGVREFLRYFYDTEKYRDENCDDLFQFHYLDALLFANFINYDLEYYTGGFTINFGEDQERYAIEFLETYEIDDPYFIRAMIGFFSKKALSKDDYNVFEMSGITLGRLFLDSRAMTINEICEFIFEYLDLHPEEEPEEITLMTSEHKYRYSTIPSEYKDRFDRKFIVKEYGRFL